MSEPNLVGIKDQRGVYRNVENNSIVFENSFDEYTARRKFYEDTKKRINNLERKVSILEEKLKQVLEGTDERRNS
jgi:polyhydroxyalkanoate synthesis regulator phasin